MSQKFMLRSRTRDSLKNKEIKIKKKPGLLSTTDLSTYSCRPGLKLSKLSLTSLLF